MKKYIAIIVLSLFSFGLILYLIISQKVFSVYPDSATVAIELAKGAKTLKDDAITNDEYIATQIQNISGPLKIGGVEGKKNK